MPAVEGIHQRAPFNDPIVTPVARAAGRGRGGPGAAGIGFLDPDDRRLGKQISLQVTGEIAVVAADPFEHHRGVLHLLAHVVQQDLAQLFVLGVVGALAIPVDRVELLLQRCDRVVQQPPFLRTAPRAEYADPRSTSTPSRCACIRSARARAVFNERDIGTSDPPFTLEKRPAAWDGTAWPNPLPPRRELPPTGAAAAARDGAAGRPRGQPVVEPPPLVEFGDPQLPPTDRPAGPAVTAPIRRPAVGSGQRPRAPQLSAPAAAPPHGPRDAAPHDRPVRPPARPRPSRRAGRRLRSGGSVAQSRAGRAGAAARASASALPPRWRWRSPARSGSAAIGSTGTAGGGAFPARAERRRAPSMRRPRRRSASSSRPNAPGPATPRRSCRWRSSTPKARAWRRTTPPRRNGFAPPPSAG